MMLEKKSVYIEPDRNNTEPRKIKKRYKHDIFGLAPDESIDEDGEDGLNDVIQKQRQHIFLSPIT